MIEMLQNNSPAGDSMELSQKFMKAVETELKRAGIAMELEGGEGKFDIQNIGDTKVTITVTIESHAVVFKAGEG